MYRPPLVVHDDLMVFDGRGIPLAHEGELPADWPGKLASLLPQGAMNSLNPTARIRDFTAILIN
jgi:peptide/nickel transport system ATP-binding protein